MKLGTLFKVGAFVGVIAVAKHYGGALRFDQDAALRYFQQWSDRLGIWAIPLYVAVHTLTLSLCLPYAVFFEAGAAMLFGFIPAVLCVFSAKIMGASLSFWIGRSRPCSPLLPILFFYINELCHSDLKCFRWLLAFAV